MAMGEPHPADAMGAHVAMAVRPPARLVRNAAVDDDRPAILAVVMPAEAPSSGT